MDLSHIDENTPIVFISYSWTVKKQVIDLTQRLFANGIHVVIDLYDLKEGHDKHDFMEQCVKNERITKVLMICDKTYAIKADAREGGVGDEALIISPQIYGKTQQSKFIPIVVDYDEGGKPHLPCYLESRIYIDLNLKNETYESEYEKLIRNIHNEPELRRPSLGKKPDFTYSESSHFYSLKIIPSQFQSSNTRTRNKQKALLINSLDKFISAAEDFTVESDEELIDNLLSNLERASQYKGYFIDFLKALVEQDIDISDAFTEFAEKFHNTHFAKRIERHTIYRYNVNELFAWILKDLCIATTAFCLHYKKYHELYTIVTHSYYLIDTNNDGKYCSFSKFRNPCSSIERAFEQIAKGENYKQFLSKGEYLPLLSANKIKEADMLLYILGACKVMPNLNTYNIVTWYPETYNRFHCSESIPQEVKRLESKKFCESFIALFGVKTIDELKQKINSIPPAHDTPDVRYMINIETIASIN